MAKRTAVVTGITGQDGSYLAELLLEKGYEVIGLKRRSTRADLGCSQHIANDIKVEEADVTDLASLMRLARVAKPHEWYNLAAQSHVHTSFNQPDYTLMASGTGVLNCLEAIRHSGFHTRFYQASSSEQFGGNNGDVPNGEDTPFHPRSPYACAKLYGYWITVNYRESYRMFTCNGILHNHESPRRGYNFVTRKITIAAARINAGLQKELYLGNMDAKRDWGHAKDYVRGMWMMMQHPEPDDYVLATGESHSVREFCEIAFRHANLGDYQQYVKIDPGLYRPAEVNILLGNAGKARGVLGWKPEISFEKLVHEMVAEDMEAARVERDVLKR